MQRSHSVRRAVCAAAFSEWRNAAILAFVAALLGGLAALLAVLRERRSIPKWCFVAGMALLALESLFSGLADLTDQGGEAIKYWQQWRLAAMSFLPGVWLLFSFSYPRGNHREFLFKWRLMLVLAFVLPAAIVCFFYHDLLTVDFTSIKPDLRVLHLKMAGQVLYHFIPDRRRAGADEPGTHFPRFRRDDEVAD